MTTAAEPKETMVDVIKMMDQNMHRMIVIMERMAAVQKEMAALQKQLKMTLMRLEQ
jgi:hypothetical protein